MPPNTAIGITLMVRTVSTTDPKLNQISMAISVRLIGTTIDSRLIASCRLPNSPTHSSREPGGNCTWAATFSCASWIGAAKIALAHRELDRQIALLLFAVDVGRARYQLDGCDLAQRHLRDAVRALRADPQILDRFRALAVLRRQANDDREMPVAAGLIEVAGAVASDRGA